MHTPGLEAFALHISVALLVVYLIVKSYDLIKPSNQDPVQRSYRYIVLGVIPLSSLHLVYAFEAIGMVQIENGMSLMYIEHALFAVLILSMIYGVNIAKKGTFDKMDAFKERISKKKRDA